ncbi:hypothetical protein BDN71DRAFT_1436264 [Pleurotus eryngii]|uniref:Uncharacterized protein n=1 Tax=Pleurotus eryngii TaxID=5323 RepID=A0A9P5ZI82_PLEER|nr:hypothetical protein BDN71DRAFT_1436264 [Pleurotus eryngii]
MSKKSSPDNVAGDYYAGDQVGANVGGHNNTNHVFNGGKDDFETQLTRIKAMYGAQNQSMRKGDYYATLGEVQKIKDSLQDLMNKVNTFNDKVEADFQKKFLRNEARNMVELDSDQGWKVAGKHGK